MVKDRITLVEIIKELESGDEVGQENAARLRAWLAEEEKVNVVP